jgi:pimeloyl-ACP methyl ester carboxylesterase
MAGYRFRGETKVLDDTERASAPGQFVALTDGVTHYEVAGPVNQMMTVLVHGFSVPYFIWDPTFTGLASARLRVLRYDLFGRGYSDRPDTVYNQACFDRQLVDLLDALAVDKPINLIGLSMGGAVAVGFADNHPERVSRLALIDPAGMPMKQSPLMGIMRIPGMGEWLFDNFAEKLLVARLAKDFYTRDKVQEFEARYRVQMQYIGFKRALISTLRNGPMQSMAEAYAHVGQHPRPALLIWGKEDRTVPFDLSQKVREALPNAAFYAVDNAGHIPHYEHPELINPLLIKFLT